MRKNSVLNFFKHPIGILLLAGLFFRIILFFMYQPYNHIDEVIVSDAAGYHQLALNLVNNGNFIAPNSTLDTIRTPIYPLFLALFYYIFGVNISVVILFQQLFLLASVFLLYKIGNQLFNKKIALLSAIILCFEPDHIYFSFDLLTDTLFVFLLLWGTYFFIRFIKENKLKFLIVSTFIMGIATLTRPISLLLPTVGIFVIAINAFRSKENWISVVKKSTILIFVFILAISPWSIRNKIQYDSFSLSAISGHNLLNYNAAFTIKRNSEKSINEIRKNLYLNKVLQEGDSIKIGINRFYLSNIQSKVAIDYIKNNKWEYTKANVVGIFNLYISMGYKKFLDRFSKIEKHNNHTADFDKISISWNRFLNMSPLYLSFAVLYLVYLLWMYIASFIGLLILIKKKKWVLILSVLSVICYFTMLTGIVGLNRYKLPISPYYILFVSCSTLFLLDKVRKKKNLNENQSGI